MDGKKLCRELCFPCENEQMAKVTFSVELSTDPSIRWPETVRGLRMFFAVESHEFYLELDKFLADYVQQLSGEKR